MNTHAAVGATRAGASSHKTTGSSAAAGTMASAGAAAGGNLFASLLSDAAEVAEPDIHEAAGKGTGKARKGLSTEVLPEGRGVDPLSVPMPGVLPVPEGGGLRCSRRRCLQGFQARAHWLPGPYGTGWRLVV